MPSRTPFGRGSNRHNPGKYRHSITLVASTAEHAATGDQQFSWDGAAIEVQGCWRQTSQREMLMEGGRYTTASGVWEIPWVPNLTTDYRVEFGARKYRIIGISNVDEINQELELYCVEDEGAKGTTG